MNKHWYMGGAAFTIIAVFTLAIVRFHGVSGAVNFIKDQFQNGSVAQEDADPSLLMANDDQMALNEGDIQSSSDTDIDTSSIIAPESAVKSLKTKKESQKSVSDKTTTTTDSGGAIKNNDSANNAPPISLDMPATEHAPIISTEISSCSFPSMVASSTGKIIFNEIAWMGSPSSSNTEWIELKNISSDTVDLAGWSIANASGKLKVTLSEEDKVSAGGFFMLSRGSGTGKIYSGDLTNSGDVIAVIDPQCMTSDYLDASSGWPGGNNSTKQTLERDANDIGWHTSTLPGGTPDENNSSGPPPTQYILSVAFEGAGGDAITSEPSGLICGASCSGSYAAGTRVVLTPVPGTNAVFTQWSGMCYGQTICSITMNGNISLSAEFHSTLSNSTSSTFTDIAEASTTTDGAASSSDQASTASGPGHALIKAVQIAGAASTNDLVSVYNPTSAALDMSGWKLHKKSQTGTDYSLKTFPTGSVLAPGGTFTWANSEGGFSTTISANVSSTETLSSDNSVALMNADGTVIDQVAWGTGTGQYVEGSSYPTDPTAGQLLVRRSMSGALMDTDNNANDFTLQ